MNSTRFPGVTLSVVWLNPSSVLHVDTAFSCAGCTTNLYCCILHVIFLSLSAPEGGASTYSTRFLHALSTFYNKQLLLLRYPTLSLCELPKLLLLTTRLTFVVQSRFKRKGRGRPNRHHRPMVPLCQLRIIWHASTPLLVTYKNCCPR